jgi:hypothetical protein
VFRGSQQLRSSTPIKLTFKGTKYLLSVSKNGADSLVTLSDGTNTQILTTLESDDKYVPKLLWAGDLDGDSRLDFLIYLSYHIRWMVPDAVALLLLSEVSQVAGLAAIEVYAGNSEP